MKVQIIKMQQKHVLLSLCVFSNQQLYQMLCRSYYLSNTKRCTMVHFKFHDYKLKVKYPKCLYIWNHFKIKNVQAICISILFLPFQFTVVFRHLVLSVLFSFYAIDTKEKLCQNAPIRLLIFYKNKALTLFSFNCTVQIPIPVELQYIFRTIISTN